MIVDFRELGISEDLTGLLKKNGITVPTPVQEQSIQYIRSGRDLIAQAQTGTGKTLAFLLPLFEDIDISKDQIQVLIMTPTRELAIQITNEAEKLREYKDINILAAYGGRDIGSQLRKLKKSIHIVIATPGRLIDHILRKSIDLGSVNTFVLDEADQMLMMGFRNEIEDIMTKLPKKRQMLCLSATLDSHVKRLAYRYMDNPVTVSVNREEITLESIRQNVVESIDRNKLRDLCSVLDEDNPFMAIIFCRTKRRADELEVSLHRRGYDCQKLHSDVVQAKRERIMKSFRNGDFQYLIATDVAARGLDIGGVSHIYNYDIPESAESYIHRIGRTGRAGEEGYTCLFTDPKDLKQLKAIEESIKFKIPRRKLNGGDHD